MVFTLASQMYHRISELVPVLIRVPEYLPTSTSTSTITLELTSTSKVRVPEIQYSSTASTSTEYEYPSPASGRDWKPWKKSPIPCKFCTYRFIRYPSTCCGKVRINPLMANTRNPDFFASPVANAARFVVFRPCYLNRDLLSGPKGN